MGTTIVSGEAGRIEGMECNLFELTGGFSEGLPEVSKLSSRMPCFHLAERAPFD